MRLCLLALLVYDGFMKSILDKISVLYEDNDVLVINKPAGLVAHADGKRIEPALTDWVESNYPASKGVGEPITLANAGVIERSGIVHRIDRETSGVMLIAKNQEAFIHLKKQFQDRKIEKIYHTFVWGEMKDDEGIINRPIGRSKRDFRQWSAQRGARGVMREAITHYKVVTKNGGFSFVEVMPKTGRTHQIRVHFKAINHPIVCDSLYASKKEKALGFERLALHSRSIEFGLLGGKQIKVEAPYPEDFEKALILMEEICQ